MDSSVAVSVPGGRAVASGGGGGGGCAVEKKLRKRKELDAIVAKMNNHRSSREREGGSVVSDVHDAAAVLVDAGLNTESETSDGGGGFGLRSKLIQPSSSSAKPEMALPPILLSVCQIPTCRGVVAVVAAVVVFIAVVLSVSVVVQTKAQVSEMGLQLDKGPGGRGVLAHYEMFICEGKSELVNVHKAAKYQKSIPYLQASTK